MYILRDEPFGYLLFDNNIYLSEKKMKRGQLMPKDFTCMERNCNISLSNDYFTSHTGRYINNYCPNHVISAPTTVFFEVTSKCNLKCKHCFNNSGKMTTDELSYSSISNVIDELYNVGVFLIKVTGGEPFERNDILDILKLIDSRSIKFIVYTNATNLSREIVLELSMFKNLNKVRVSLDGSKETNDKIRGKGTYRLVLESLKILLSFNVPCEINFTITPENYMQLDDIIKDLKNNNINIKINVGMVKISGRAREQNNKYYFEKENTMQCINALKRQMHNSTNILPFYELTPIYYKLFGSSFGCPAARLTATIKSNGNVFACGLFANYNNLLCGNILTDRFLHIWNNTNMNFMRNLPQNESCIRCEFYKNICTGACRGNALNYYHDVCGEDINCNFYKVNYNE